MARLTCPNDTDGDGNCGQVMCPWCSPDGKARFEKGLRMRALGAVHDELAAHDAKWGEQNHPDMSTSAEVAQWALPTADEAKAITDQAAKDGTLSWAHILFEEFCEALEEAQKLNDAWRLSDEDVEAKLEVELVQVAAVATQWVQSIKRRRRRREDVQAARMRHGAPI